MKKLILIAAMCLPCIAFSQSAQQDPKPSLGFIGFGINHCNLEEMPANVTTRIGSSIGFYGEVMNEYYFIKKKQCLSLASGFLADYNVIGSNAWLGEDASGKTTFTPIPSGIVYSQNTLTVTSAGIPIEIHYNQPIGTDGNLKFFLAGGYLIEYTSFVQTSYIKSGDSSTVVTYKNSRNMNLFRQEIVSKAGLGFRNKKNHWYYVSLDGFLGLNSLYKQNEGPKLILASGGISFSANLWGDNYKRSKRS